MITPPVSDTPNKSYIFPSSKRKTTVLHDFLQIEPWGLRETCPKSSQGCYPSVLSRKWGGKYPLTPPLSQVILNKTSAPNDLSVIVSDADFLSRTMMDSTNYLTSFDHQLDLVISGTFFDI